MLTLSQKLPKNVGDLGKLIFAKGLKSCPKSNNSPNLVTLPTNEWTDGRTADVETDNWTDLVQTFLCFEANPAGLF